MTRQCRWKRVGHLDDSGFGLVETMVGIVIFTVVTGLLTTFVIDMLRTGVGVNNRLTNVDQLRVAMDELSKGLRIAVRPEQIDTSCVDTTQADCDVSLYAPAADAVRFYANHGDIDAAGNAGVRLTTYQVEADPDYPGTGRLVASIGRPSNPVALNNASCGSGCVTRFLARNLVWPVQAPVFTYAGSDCSTFSPPPATQPTALSANSACVAVTLQTAGARDNAGAGVTSAVFLPNSVIGR